MKQQFVEMMGILASLLILTSMLAKTTSYKGTMFMRIFNTLGSIIFVVYGLLLPALATAFMNGLIILINIFYIIKEYRHHKNHHISI